MKTLIISVFWFIIFALLLLILIRSEVKGAPAPWPARQRVTPGGQRHISHWYGSYRLSRWMSWAIHLGPSGRYMALSDNGLCYVGTWCLASGVITIREHPADCPAGSPFVYEVPLAEFGRGDN